MTLFFAPFFSPASPALGCGSSALTYQVSLLAGYRFIIWCQWSNMIIRVDKCFTFGIRKLCTKSVQYLPKLLINGILVPCVEMGESFRYLGRYFDFNMSNNQHMPELSSLVQDLMCDIDEKPLHPKNKLLLYSRYVLSKLSWHFTVADISKNLDNSKS